MKTANRFLILWNVLAITGCVLMLSGCGTSSSQTSLNSSNSTTGGTTVTTGTGNYLNLPAAMEQQVDLSGAGGPMPSKTITTSTSRTLVVKVTALAAQNLTIPGYQNWVFPYGCLQVNVNVNGSTQTALMQVANVAQGSSSPCAGAPAFKVLNFSNVMSGSGPTTVTITNPVYDNCRTYNPFYYGCYMSAVWMNHIVAANVTVQVDGTWMDTTIP